MQLFCQGNRPSCGGVHQRQRKLAWVLTAQFLTARSILVPFFLLIALILHYVIIGESRRAFSRIIALVASVSVTILFVEFVKVTFARANVCEYLTVGVYGFRYPAVVNNPDLSSFPSEFGANRAQSA